MNFKSELSNLNIYKEKDEQLSIDEKLQYIGYNNMNETNKISKKNNNSKNLSSNFFKDNTHLQSFINNINNLTKNSKIDNNKGNLENKEGKTIETNYTDKILFKKIDNKEILDKNKIPNININNFIFIDDKKILVENLDNIIESKNIKLSYDEQDFSHIKIDINMKIDRKKNNQFLGKKRENLNNQRIFNEINELYSQYNGNSPDYKLFVNKNGLFKKNITVVEENIPLCVIYFTKESIDKIYLIIEKKDIEDEQEIYEILNNIKKNILNYKNFYPTKFSKY